MEGLIERRGCLPKRTSKRPNNSSTPISVRWYFYSLRCQAAFDCPAHAISKKQDTVEGPGMVTPSLFNQIVSSLQPLILSISLELGGKCLHFSVIVAPATLLFRLCFFSFVPGEIGLFSATLTPFFIMGATSAVLLSGIVEIFGGAPIPLGRC